MSEQEIWERLLKITGGNKFGAAGLMGNLSAESALLSNNLQNTYEYSLGFNDTSYTTAVDNGSYNNFVYDQAGYGLAQWTYYTRKQGLLNYAKSTGRSIGDIGMQLDYLEKELTESYPGVLNDLKNATSVKGASDSVIVKYENPRDQSDGAKNFRASKGQSYFDKYNVAEVKEEKKEEPKEEPVDSKKEEPTNKQPEEKKEEPVSKEPEKNKEDIIDFKETNLLTSGFSGKVSITKRKNTDDVVNMSSSNNCLDIDAIESVKKEISTEQEFFSTEVIKNTSNISDALNELNPNTISKLASLGYTNDSIIDTVNNYNKIIDNNLSNALFNISSIEKELRAIDEDIKNEAYTDEYQSVNTNSNNTLSSINSKNSSDLSNSRVGILTINSKMNVLDSSNNSVSIEPNSYNLMGIKKINGSYYYQVNNSGNNYFVSVDSSNINVKCKDGIISNEVIRVNSSQVNLYEIENNNANVISQILAEQLFYMNQEYKKINDEIYIKAIGTDKEGYILFDDSVSLEEI